jgi:hypothetical protein
MTIDMTSPRSIGRQNDVRRIEHCSEPVADLNVQIGGVRDGSDRGQSFSIADIKSNLAIDAPVDSSDHATFHPVSICRKIAFSGRRQGNERALTKATKRRPGVSLSSRSASLFQEAGDRPHG